MFQEVPEFRCYFDDKIVFLQLEQERAAGDLLSVCFQPNPL